MAKIFVCPKCKVGELVETPSGYVCTNNCSGVFPKKSISLSELKILARNAAFAALPKVEKIGWFYHARYSLDGRGIYMPAYKDSPSAIKANYHGRIVYLKRDEVTEEKLRQLIQRTEA
jgi:hypothetical protein